MNSFIEQTYLKPYAKESDIARLCQEANEWNFYGICVAPRWIKFAKSLINKSKIITVVGFPHGDTLSSIKIKETELATEADEIDMVISIGQAKENRWKRVTEEIKEIVQAAQGRVVKVIFEICYFRDDEIVSLCQCAEEGGAQFVKTSTGFAPSGATIEAVRLMHQSIPSSMGVKAAGGIRTREEAEAMIEAGATRIGTSSGINICTP